MADREWVWVALTVAQAAHAEQIAEHGGDEGVRDAGLLESAMARPRNPASYGDPDAAALAAAYAYGIARNHPFVDGNKRTAAVVSETFLMLNGHVLTASDAELVVAFLALAAGELGEEELGDWFRGAYRRRLRDRATRPARASRGSGGYGVSVEALSAGSAAIPAAIMAASVSSARERSEASARERSWRIHWGARLSTAAMTTVNSSCVMAARHQNLIETATKPLWLKG